MKKFNDFELRLKSYNPSFNEAILYNMNNNF